LTRVLDNEWTGVERIELEIIASEIRHLKESIKKLDKAIGREAAKMKGYRNLVSITGIGSRSAGVLLSIIGEVKDFASADKLAAYFGIVPRVSNSNETIKIGRSPNAEIRPGGQHLCNARSPPFVVTRILKTYYEQVKARRGRGKAKIATARKYLTLIYNTLSNDRVFADFKNFELAE